MGMFVSGNFFDVLGVPAAIGRTWAPEEGEVVGRDPVLVLGHDFWAGVLGADRSVVGREVWLNGTAFTIIGVAPERFTGMDQYLRPSFFVPATMKPALSRDADDSIENRGTRSFVMRGRLKSGVTKAQAQTELSVLWRDLQRQHPDQTRNQDVVIRTDLQARFRESPEDAMLMVMLLGLVAVVLAIACANVASLLLGHARSRAREIAIRLALGVGPGRLLRQLLTESALLAAGGCIVGVGLAYLAIRFLLNIQVPTDLPIVIAPELDRRVLMFSVIAAAGSAVLFGLAPAWRSVRTDLVPGLKRSTDGRTSRQRTVGRNILVVGQIALAMVLLVAAVTMLAGFRQALGLDPGFRTDRLLMMTFDTSLTGAAPDETRQFYRQLVDGAAEVPGVVSVALTGAVPLDPSGEIRNVVPEGHQFPAGQEHAQVFAATVDEHYFRVVGTAVVSGRGFTTEDRASTRPVVVVNQEFARRYWPGTDPIGKRLRLASDDSPWMEIVGIARTGKYFFIGEPPRPFIYLPFAQHDRSRMSLIVESASADPSGLAAPLRGLVRDLKPDQPIYNVRPLSTFYEQRALAVPRQLLQVITTMGAMGLALALIGLYGVIAFSVGSRTREIGIRMAIGATRSNVMRMILRQGLVLSLAGIGFGIIGSIAVGYLLSAGLIGLGEPSRASFIPVPLLLLALTLAACYVPARRASRIDPLRAVRED
jgi:predicted permease